MKQLFFCFLFLVSSATMVSFADNFNEGMTSEKMIIEDNSGKLPRTFTLGELDCTLDRTVLVGKTVVVTESGSGAVSTNDTCSADAKGGMMFVLPGYGCLSAVSVPYSNPTSEDGLFKFGETGIAQGLPVGSWVLFWDVEKQKWGGGMKSAFGWDPAEFNHVLSIGEGFYVRNVGEKVEVPITGKKPVEACLTRAYAGTNAWSIMAYPYPTEIKFGDTAIAQKLPEGSYVAFWDMDNQCWRGGVKSRKWDSSVTNYVNKWGPSEANRLVKVGEPFFIRNSGASGVWKVDRPY